MSEFTINPAGIEEVASSDEMREATKAIAEELADDIRALVPVGKGAGPHAVDSIDVQELEEVPGGQRVASDSPLMRLIEFGTGMRETHSGAGRGEMPAFAPFRRAAEAHSGYRPAAD